MTAWKIAFERSKREIGRKIRDIAPYGDKVTMKYYWRLWQAYVRNMIEEREIEYRAKQKWNMVSGWLKK